VNLVSKGVCIAGMAIQRRSEASRRVTSAAFVAYTLSTRPVLLPRYSNMRNPLDNDCQRVFSFLVFIFCAAYPGSRRVSCLPSFFIPLGVVKG